MLGAEGERRWEEHRAAKCQQDLEAAEVSRSFLLSAASGVLGCVQLRLLPVLSLPPGPRHRFPDTA